MARGNSQSRGLVPFTQPGKSLWCRKPNKPLEITRSPLHQIVLRACGMAAKATARPSIEYRARDMPRHAARRGFVAHIRQPTLTNPFCQGVDQRPS